MEPLTKNEFRRLMGDISRARALVGSIKSETLRIKAVEAGSLDEFALYALLEALKNLEEHILTAYWFYDVPEVNSEDPPF